MKKCIGCLLTIFVAVSLTASNASALGPIGFVDSIGKGFSLGAGYFYDQDKLKPKEDGFPDIKVRQNVGYVQAAYGMDRAAFYVRLGGADFKGKLLDVNEDFDTIKDGMKPFGTAGVNVSFFKTNGFSVGAFAQGSYVFGDYKDEYSTSGSRATPYGVATGTDTTEVKVKNMWNVTLGLTGQVKAGPVIIYGGPFAYWTHAKVEAEVTSTGTLAGMTGTITTSADSKYTEKGNFGGFLGVAFQATKALTIGVEGQLRKELSVGANISYAF